MYLIHHGLQRSRKTILSHLSHAIRLANPYWTWGAGGNATISARELVNSIWVQDDLESTWQSLWGVSGRPGLQTQLTCFVFVWQLPSLSCIPLIMLYLQVLSSFTVWNFLGMCLRNQLSGKSLLRGLLWGWGGKTTWNLNTTGKREWNIQGAFM